MMLASLGSMPMCSRTVIKNKIKSLTSLKGEIEANYEWMLCKLEDIPFSKCISNEILLQYLLLLKYLHRKYLLGIFLLYKIN